MFLLKTIVGTLHWDRDIKTTDSPVLCKRLYYNNINCPKSGLGKREKSLSIVVNKTKIRFEIILPPILNMSKTADIANYEANHVYDAAVDVFNNGNRNVYF